MANAITPHQRNILEIEKPVKVLFRPRTTLYLFVTKNLNSISWSSLFKERTSSLGQEQRIPGRLRMVKYRKESAVKERNEIPIPEQG